MKLEFLKTIQTPDMINITIKKVFEEKINNFGKASKNCVVEWNGKEYYSEFGTKYYPIAIEGNKVAAVRKLYQGKPYFEYFSGGDGLTPNPGLYQPAQAAPVQAPFPTQEVVSEKPPVNLIGRGASYNLAFQLALKANYPSLGDMLKDVEKFAEQILPSQNKFVNQ